ncbi:ankyrin repeat ph and sec7 domain containing protein secg-related [Anaeramoeba ignava]|uniref:Ankyrin repeat ph and sec7 domain containing protein secg-related n=1 Tax=Anaeramoeba ignava TaxID=1746090 RepID=A0A9Q0LDQ1_ANAIG|nr:ankyrin repeat ph and sec7 domain containing protein secg-related [Anaeramoeba ignava]
MDLFDLIKQNKIEEISSFEGNFNQKNSKEISPLHYACLISKNFDLIKLLIEKGAEPKNVTNSGKTALHFAALQNFKQAIPFLISKGIDVNSKDNKKRSPIYDAFSKKIEFDTIKTLIENGANINLESSSKSTPFSDALTKNCSREVLNLLIENGAKSFKTKSKQTILHICSKYKRDVSFLESFPDEIANIDSKDIYSKTALMYACEKSNISFVKYLLSKGANPNLINDEERTALHFACNSNYQKDIIEVLVEKGASVIAQDIQMNTPLHYLVKNRISFDLIDLFLSKGANINACNNEGESILHIACKSGVNHKLIQYLLSKSAKAESFTNIYFRSPLEYVCSYSLNNKVIETLLLNGANPESRQSNGYTPLFSACSYSSSLAPIKTLIKYGADVRSVSFYQGFDALCLAVKNPKGTKIVKYFIEDLKMNPKYRTESSDTLLHLACRIKKNIETIKYLLSVQKLNPNSLNYNNETPLSLACIFGAESEVIKLLLDYGACADVKDNYKRLPIYFEIIHLNRFEVVKLLANSNQFIESLTDDRKNINKVCYGKFTVQAACNTKIDLETFKFIFEKSKESNGDIGLLPMNQILINILKKKAQYDIIHFIFSENKFDWNSPNSNLFQTLCIYRFEKDIFQLFIDKGANVNESDSTRKTALYKYLELNHHPDIEIIQLLINSGADVNIKTTSNETVLHSACSNSHLISHLKPKKVIEIFNLLISAGCDIHEKDIHSNTILHFLAKKNTHIKIFKYFVNLGLKVTQNAAKQNPLHLYCQVAQANQKVMKYLIKCGADIDELDRTSNLPLHYYLSSNNKIEIVKLLVNTNQKNSLINVFNFSSKSPLHIACEKNLNLNIIEYLVKNGALVNLKNTRSLTPFYYLQRQNPKEDVVRFFLDSDLNLNFEDWNNCNYIQNAILKGVNLNTLELMLSKMSKDKLPNSPIKVEYMYVSYSAKSIYDFEYFKYIWDNQLFGPIKNTEPYQMFFIRSEMYRNINTKEQLEFFVKKKFNLFKKDIYHPFPFFKICERDPSIELIKLITNEDNCNVKERDNHLLEILMYICSKSHKTEIIDHIISLGVDINSKLQEDSNCLIRACEKNLPVEVIEHLISKGADVNSQNKAKQKPLFFSVSKKNPENTEMLIRNGANMDLVIPSIGSLIQFVFSNENWELAKIFLSYDADVQNLNFEKISNKSQAQEVIQLYYSICYDMMNLFERKEFCDIKIATIDKTVEVHSLVLRCRLFDEFDIPSQIPYQKFFDMMKIFQRMESHQVEIFFHFVYSGIIKYSSQEELEKNTKIIHEICEKFTEDPKKWIDKKKGRKNLVRDLNKLYQDESSKDFKIQVTEKDQKKVFSIHKVILIARSELFRGMFLNVKDDSDFVNDYSEKSIQTISLVIKFLYLDDLDEKEISNDVFQELEDVIDYYQLNENSRLKMILDSQKINFK